MADHNRATALIRGAIITGIVCLALAGLGILIGTKKEKDTVVPTTTTEIREAAIPSIDLAAPTQTETATFALG